MTRTMLAVLAAALMFDGGTMAAHAQPPNCGSAVQIIAFVTGQKYNEVGMIEMNAGSMTHQIYTNPKTGTWTLVTIRSDGYACYLSGEGGVKPMEAAKPKETKS